MCLITCLARFYRWNGQSLIRNVAIDGHPSESDQAKATDRDEAIRHTELCDRQLDALSRNVRCLRVKTNWECLHLGKAYEACGIVSTAFPSENLEPPTQLQVGPGTLTYPGCPPGNYQPCTRSMIRLYTAVCTRCPQKSPGT